MRYGLDLLPNLMLLVALLRMARVGMATTRPASFFFFSLCVWFVYSLVTLFLGQIWEDGTRAYQIAFLSCSVPAWLCAAPALWIASRRLSLGSAIFVLVILAMAAGAARLAMLNSLMVGMAKLLAINYWVAVVAGTVLVLAAQRVEGAYATLWRCCGIFFLLFGFVCLAFGILRLDEQAFHYAYIGFVLSVTVVWFALAYFIGPRPEHLFTLEKLGIIWSVAKMFGFAIPIPVRRSTP